MVLLTVGLLSPSFTHAQESFNASGNDASGIGGSVTYSIGQVCFNTNTGPSGSVAQGVQHAFEVFIVDIKETAIDISLTAFPNPTTDLLTLEISNIYSEKLSYQVYDILGKLLNEGQIVAQKTQIYMTSLPSSTYFIHIFNQANQRIQSFKIFKN